MNDLHSLRPKRILVCQLKQIGDVIISTACISLLRKHYPEARLDVLTEARSAPVLEHNPDIEQVWAIDKSGSWLDSLRFSRKVALQGYDLVVDFQQLPRCRLVALLSRAPVRLTYATRKWYKRLGYTHFAAVEQGGYAGRAKAAVLRPLGVEWGLEPPKMVLCDAEKAWAGEFLRSSGLLAGERLVAVDATHWSPTRRWFPERYAQTVDRVCRARSDVRFCLLYGPGERGTVQRILEMVEHPERVFLPPDEPPSLRRTAAIIGSSDAFLGNCSAPRHMAAALGVPSLVVVGSNGNTAWNYPSTMHGNVDMKVPCRKCNKDECPNGTLACLKAVEAANVADRLLTVLSGGDAALPRKNAPRHNGED